MRTPLTSTYRLQLHHEFTFADATKRLPYLAKLGISHVYCSPILTAVPGSNHGYDVLDHTHINPELGGRDGFVAFAEDAHELGLGVIVDVVPNHMAFVAPESRNKPLWHLLKTGQHGPYAHWFDVDWDACDGKIGVPILGQPLEQELTDGAIRLDVSGDEPVIRYYEHVFPVAGSVSGLAADGELSVADLTDVLERQHYQLGYWRDRDALLNYRRFFDVNELIAIRVENRDVFDATHALLLDLHHAGLIDGFRIDHPDGLADPQGYLEWLSAECLPEAPVWVEKILEPGEQLPREWPVAGTTGYDAMTAISAALADETTRGTLKETWQQAIVAGTATTPDDAVIEAKRYVITNNLTPEVDRLTRRAHAVRPEMEADKLRAAIVELLVAAPVYRAYVRDGHEMTPQAMEHLTQAVNGAKESAPHLNTEIDVLALMAVMDVHAATDEFADVQDDLVDFATRLQQTWGPAMAKSIEDTLFYRWHLLTALNEVGSEVTLLEHAGAERLHEWARAAAAQWPRTMTGLSTHDTKRSEDVRAALLTLAGDERAWRDISAAAFALADVMGVDRASAHLVWQTIAALGFDIEPQRITDYLTKALREAKQLTAWIDGDEAYEEQVITFALAILQARPPRESTGEVAASVDAEANLAWQARHAIEDARGRLEAAMTLTGHTQKALQLLLPGVPDTYQGTEGPSFALVDPDNRRPVDYDHLETLFDVPGSRVRLVQRLLAGDVRAAAAPSGEYEPLVTSAPEVFGFVRTQPASTWQAVKAVGAQAKRQVGNLLPGRDADDEAGSSLAAGPAVAVVALRHAAKLLGSDQPADAGGSTSGNSLGDATVDLPAGSWRHAFTGELFHISGPMRLAQLGTHEFGQLHVLVKENA